MGNFSSALSVANKRENLDRNWSGMIWDTYWFILWLIWRIMKEKKCGVCVVSGFDRYHREFDHIEKNSQ